MIFTEEHILLIDTGSNASESILLSACAYYGANKIDTVILTHADEDHAGGLDAILNSCSVSRVLLTQTAYNELFTTYEGVALQNAVLKEQTELILITKGDVLSYGKARLTVVSPSEQEAAILGSGNESGPILLFEFGDTRALFTGDVGEAGEILATATLAATYPKITYDLLLVGHHGSATSSCESFIQYVSPRFSVISCGENNSYGHPSITVLNRLRSVSSEILRTDRDGTVILHSDGKTMKRLLPQNDSRY